MLISESQKLLFIHIQKTGGESIARMLTERVPGIRRLGAKHEFARSARVRLGAAWGDYFKFAFVRNPWDRLVSWYTMIRDARQISPIKAIFSRRKRSHLRQIESNPLWRYFYDHCSTFEEFVRNCTGEVESGEGVLYSFAYNQLDYLVDEEGRVMVDFVGRFENFSVDVQKVATRARIGPGPIVRANVSRHRHYSSYYTPQLERIVGDRFARDIAHFGYVFEHRS
jgi:Sulfotransferase family